MTTEPLFEIPPESAINAKKQGGKPRLQRADRQQVVVQLAALDDMIPADHLVRLVWEMVAGMNLSPFYAEIEAVEGDAGRSAIDPAILIALWLYATLQRVGSARELARLCEEHVAYRWILGGVSVNYHTLADFRTAHEAKLDALLKEGVAALLAEGLINLDETAQDGMRLRGGAGSSSFHRRQILEEHLQTAEQQVEQLKQTPEQGPRQAAAQKRAAREKVNRLHKALEALEEIEQKRKKAHRKKSERQAPKASETDSEVRIMKMPDGGYRPAVNVELAVETAHAVILEVGVINTVDQGKMVPMLEQIHASYGAYPHRHLIDKGFVTLPEIETAEGQGVAVYAPIPDTYKTPQKEALLGKGTENNLPAEPAPESLPPQSKGKTYGPGAQKWLVRMETAEAKAIYKHRPASVECANADARQRGLYQVLVRGLQKIRAVLLWFALAHNFLRAYALRKEKATATAGI
jgi:transposase